MLKQAPLTAIGVAIYAIGASIKNGSAGPLTPDQIDNMHKAIEIGGSFEQAGTAAAFGVGGFLAGRRQAAAAKTTDAPPAAFGNGTITISIPPSPPPNFSISLGLPTLSSLPPTEGKKTNATTPGGPITLSGVQASAIPGYDGLPAVGVWESAQQTGIQLSPHGFFDPILGAPGAYAASHAEPQALYLNPAADFLVVSKPPCCRCCSYISQTAQLRGFPITVLSPAGFQFFLTNGAVYPPPDKK
jgi:hypothetical protein